MRIIVLVGWLLLSVLPMSPALAQQVVLADDPPSTYVVKTGDTLWHIAGKFLRDPWMWPDIWEVNPQLDNPHLIFPGDELYLEYVDGQPRLRVRRGTTSRTVKLTPTMRIEPLDNAIPAISLEDIGAWLKDHRVLEPEDIQGAPYVVAGDQRRLLSGAGDRLYARGQFPEGETGYSILRQGEIYVDPTTQEVLGYQAIDIGSARMLDNHLDDVSQMEVTRVTEDVRQGDRLLPNEARSINDSFQPSAPDSEIDGLMIAVDAGITQIGTLDVVAINRGTREGVAVGNVLAIFRTGEVVHDPVRGENVKMPDTRAGLMMLFRVFEKMSYGVVLKSNRPLAVLDRVANP